MTEFLTLLPPDLAREKLFSNLPDSQPDAELVDTTAALGRITAEVIRAPHPLPEFRRSTVDGFAVQASETFGASDSLPVYLSLLGEVPMGDIPASALEKGGCMIIHTGGMLPEGADAVVMHEYTQTVAVDSGISQNEIEIHRPVSAGENIIEIGEDVAQDQVILARGVRIRPAEVGGLLALGFTRLRVVKKIKVGLISTGDEVISPEKTPRPGQVRDINTHTLAALVTLAGGQPALYGIVGDTFDALQGVTARALSECHMVVITAGSSASIRDMTARVIETLGKPGVLVHGINTRPGKPTILGACDGKPVIGLPGNPVSALVNGYMLVLPLIEHLLDQIPRPQATVQARLSINLASQSGREDWWPVRLNLDSRSGSADYIAEPIFGKSNLIFTLAAADGLLRIPSDATGLDAGEMVEVLLT